MLAPVVRVSFVVLVLLSDFGPAVCALATRGPSNQFGVRGVRMGGQAMTDRLVSSLKPLFRVGSGRRGSALLLLLVDESLLMKDGGGGGSKHSVLTWGGVLLCCVVVLQPGAGDLPL